MPATSQSKKSLKEFGATFRHIIVFLLIVVLVFVLGLFIGYSLIGDGKFWEVLNARTWQHILDFLN